MKNFALVVCCEKDEQIQRKKSFFQWFIKTIKTFILGFKKKELFKDSIKEIKLAEELGMSIITLPYSLSELKIIGKRRIKQINKFLDSFCLESKTSFCILPESIGRIQCFNNCIVNPFRGEYLYKCLLENIIHEIFTKQGIKTWELGITIIQGRSRQSLYTVIELLSPMVKFLTVVSAERDIIEQEAGEDFLDSGLAVIITADWKNALKNSDLIINLEDEKNLISMAKTRKGSVFLNINSSNPEVITCKSVIVNGIDIRIPDTLSEALGSNIYNYFKAHEIAEIIISFRLGIEREVDGDIFPTNDKIKLVAREFKKDGFDIKGFAGRHNILKAKEITDMRE